MIWIQLLKSRTVHGALIGLLTAAATDYHAFMGWKSFTDLKSYNWNVAAFRWVQGAFIGAVTSAGLGQL